MDSNIYFLIIKLIFIMNFFFNFLLSKFKSGDGGWGLGDWGWGIGDWGLGPIPNPQSPIPNPPTPIPHFLSIS